MEPTEQQLAPIISVEETPMVVLQPASSGEEKREENEEREESAEPEQKTKTDRKKKEERKENEER